MTNKISKEVRLASLDALLDARMAHTCWVAEVVKNANPVVEEDHTQCVFGKWLIAAAANLQEVQEFEALIAPHQKLHDAYRDRNKIASPQAFHRQIKDASRTLINQIDALEKRLNLVA